LATISLIALSTNAVEIGSSRRRRAGVVHLRVLVALEVAEKLADVSLKSVDVDYPA
jgi:hypothetical protein